MRVHHTLLSLALALASLQGQLTDTTTGQGLAGVTVTASGPSRLTTTSDASGRFRFTNLKPGSYTLHMESNDVPPVTEMVRLQANQRRTLNLKLCSTTLDYHCGQGPKGPGGA